VGSEKTWIRRAGWFLLGELALLHAEVFNLLGAIACGCARLCHRAQRACITLCARAAFELRE
jgi:hypothetical protein